MPNNFYSERQYYTIGVEIGDIDYTANLRRLRITSSAITKYQDITLELEIEPEMILNKEEFFEKTISINVQQLSEDLNPGENYSLELLCVKIDGLNLRNFSTPTINERPGGALRDTIFLGCIPIIAYKHMSKYVSKCFMEDFQKPPIDVVNFMCTNFLSTMRKSIDSNDTNTNPVPRTFNIQPMAFSTFIDWMDGKNMPNLDPNFYGPIYNGPFIAFHGIDEFRLHSIKYKITQNPEYKVFLLPADGDLKDIMNDSVNRDDTFYSRVPIKTKNHSQGDYGSLGYRKNSRIKPDNELYKDVEFTADDIFNNNVAKSSNMNTDLHEAIKSTETYTSESSGYHDDDYWSRIRSARRLCFQSEIIIQLTRNLSVRKLMNIGIPMELEPMSLDYEQYKGKYITMASDIVYNRDQSATYICTCHLRCFRGNVKS